jgi:hypothetical protein
MLTRSGTQGPASAGAGILTFVFAVLSLAVGCELKEATQDPEADAAVNPPPPATFEEACEAVPGCEESVHDLSGPRETIWRLDIHRDDSGNVSFSAIETVQVLSAVGRPASPLGGSHLLAATNEAGEWLEARAVVFGERAQLEGEGWFYSEDVDLSDQTVSAYIQASDVARFLLLDEDGQELDVQDAPASTRNLGTSKLALGTGTSACRHVRLLGVADADFVPSKLWAHIKDGPFEPGPTQRAVVQAALNQMQPLVCHSVGRIAFVEINACPSVNAQVVGGHAADMILINALGTYREENLASSREAQLELMRVILHEAGHTFDNLLSHEGKALGNLIERANPPGGWTFEAESAGWDTVAELRLGKGLAAEWKRLTRDFKEAGFGTSTYHPAVQLGDCVYTGETKEWGPEQVAQGGFMSRYGGTNHADDLAEMLATPTMGPLMRSEGFSIEDYACQVMRGIQSPDGVPIHVAAAYTKLRFLQTLGGISQDAFDACVGDVGFTSTTPGFHLFQGGKFLRSFDQGVTAKIGLDESAGVHVFLMTGEGQAQFDGKTYDGTMTLRLNVGSGGTPIEQVSWPRGGYKFTEVHINENSFLFHMPDAPAGSFDVTQGFVLVAEASNKKIDGSIVVQKVMRWLAPLPVPEVYDPPLVIRFMIEK